MERSDEIRAAYEGVCAAMAGGQLDMLAQQVSRHDGVVLLGTDPQERFMGHDMVLSIFRAQVEELGGGMPVVPTDPRAFAEGSVGWVEDQPRFDMPGGDQIPMRLTMVFHKEDGDWKVVQAHFSIGVSNEQAFGQELTTEAQ